MDKAKVFWSGGSQAVRMPKKYRFDTGEISILREGRAVVLEPLAQDWVWLDSLTGPLDDDFVEAALEGR
ncbi:AbrB/MazE/SpoVT family DNA-binding domain-containing protein [Mesorhizobium ciceri]|uniref:SpoVT/AbrB-like protein n=1 Tax=Mesorhizobium ciceri biovar biserrulae (strain HAMBI 2942 / LMG 23838 / WSM1271) TaxID=765698 RepID=E8THZ2_MESCW|nr:MULTISPECIES: AbrB/MazE/SpoVT family DNA-binding domain-containing protein [Mesorhizobium]ADV11250.1 SpoVT/AbrB-like protein [Mesorhizobium ciceri biovar biserrulae WSM1271]AMX94506.1 AbrB family transcriptional regulator [Mesorhizobium ciceri]AMY02033.1 AbrB family transcriptional regulator [Mesorhizobium ciceri biovar biserrulae]MDF3209313.1 AbrB/MazE/SpoVT family DNA-binding domain-containing protein [Mesorhizobium sp. LMG15046]MDF3228113.1 AbrB/MazE/SpoVT family DNA-binding domain-conta